MRPHRVVVLGGGVAGLTAAYRIRGEAERRGLPIDLEVLEAGPDIGGKIGTVSEDGFLCETGPNGFLDNEPATLRLVDDLGLREDLRRSEDASRKRYIVRGGKLVEVHMNPVKFMQSPLLSWPAKIRMGMEFFVPAKKNDDDETVGSFGRRRLGGEFTDVMLSSMVSGIYAGDVDRLSLAAAFPKVVALEKNYGGLLRGMMTKQKEVRARKKAAAAEAAKNPQANGAKTGEPKKVEAGPGGVLHSFREGMGQPLRTIADLLGPDVVKTKTPVARVERREDGFRVHLAEGGSIEADAVVCTVPSPAASQILRGCADQAADALAEIHVAGVHVVHLGFRRDQVRHDLEAFGALIPRSEGIRTLGSIFASSTFSGRAPKGYVLLTNMIGGRLDPAADELDERQLREQVMRDIDPLVGLNGEPVFTRVFRWARGIPQYELGHLERMRRVHEDVARVPGLHVGGNSVVGVSFNHCVLHAETLGVEVCDGLQRRPRETAAPQQGEAS